jgi:hypothetical protein
MANDRDIEFKESGLNEHRQFLLAHATHSYHAISQFMKKEDGSPLWVLNEGEYIMMNTFHLTVDHVFYEMKLHPWTITNSLDLFVERYGYHDQGGLAFTHDMGVANGLSPKGYSSYELLNLGGCFGYMTHEELLKFGKYLSTCRILYHSCSNNILEGVLKILLKIYLKTY